MRLSALELANRSAIGAIIIDRNGDGTHLVVEPDDKNRTYGIDGRLGIGENTMFHSYSFTPKILVQALLQYNDNDEIFGTNLRCSWLRSANTGFYIVYNEVDESGAGALPKGRELIIKYSYIFDVLR